MNERTISRRRLLTLSTGAVAVGLAGCVEGLGGGEGGEGGGGEGGEGGGGEGGEGGGGEGGEGGDGEGGGEGGY